MAAANTNRVSRFETSVASRDDLLSASKAIRDDLTHTSEQKLLQASKAIHDEIAGKVDKDLQAATEDLRLMLDEGLGAASGEHARRHNDLERRLDKLEEKIVGLEQLYHNGIKQILETIRSLPTPEVTVNVPEMNPTVSVKSPDVQVIVPPRRKRISYDGAGRPVEIVEE